MSNEKNDKSAEAHLEALKAFESLQNKIINSIIKISDSSFNMNGFVTVNAGIENEIEIYCNQAINRSELEWVGCLDFIQGSSTLIQVIMVKYYFNSNELTPNLSFDKSSLIVVFPGIHEALRNKFREMAYWEIMFVPPNFTYSEIEKNSAKKMAMVFDSNVGDTAKSISNILRAAYGISENDAIEAKIWYEKIG